MKRIIIVEDEALIADHLALLLEEMGHEVLAVVDNSDDLFRELESKNPDVVLLDIQIQGALDGVDISHVLNQKYQLPFIFISSNSDDRTLSRVKHSSPAGFITKPFKPEQLKTVLTLLPEASKEATVNESEASHFFVKDSLGHVKIAYQDVLYAKADDNYTQLITSGKRHMLSSTLKEVESKLKSHGFYRCHRSYLVNINKVDRLGGNFVMIEEHEIPVSESLKKELTDRLNLL